MEDRSAADWEEMLDRLSVCITQQEEEALRQETAHKGSPSHCTDLHNYVAALLVKHSLTTWAHLQASFPGVIFLHAIIAPAILPMHGPFGRRLSKRCQSGSMLRAVTLPERLYLCCPQRYIPVRGPMSVARLLTHYFAGLQSTVKGLEMMERRIHGKMK